MPVRPIYMTSGPSRSITLGKQNVRLEHAPKWKLVFGKGHSGEVVRALAWAGPKHIEESLEMLAAKVPRAEFEEIVGNGNLLPSWMVQPIARLITHA